jgi:hypothetical protein
MDFIQTEILDESYKKDEASGGESSKQNDDVDKKIQLKITRLNENFLSNLKVNSIYFLQIIVFKHILLAFSIADLGHFFEFLKSFLQSLFMLMIARV